MSEPGATTISIDAVARTMIPTPLGDMHAVASEAGLLLLDFVDRRDIEKAMREFGDALVLDLEGGCPQPPLVGTPTRSAQPMREAFAPASLPTPRIRGIGCADVAAATGGSGDPPSSTRGITGPQTHLASIARELGAYFAGSAMTFATQVVLRGTAFEQKCWRYLQSIPPGETRTYGEQARALGDAGASRAVGRANGMNFLSVIVPCHRVIASNGDLAGYGGGVKRKAWLLEHERMWAMHGA